VKFEIHIPKGFLQDFVSSIAYISGSSSGTGVAFPRMHQVIIINMGSQFSSSDVYTSRPFLHETPGTIWINGKHDTPFMLENGGVTAMYAIGVKAGRLPWFADLPAIETNDLAVGADNWTSKEINILYEQLLGCMNAQQGFILIEKYLTDFLIKRDHSSLQKVKWLDSAIHTMKVQEICRHLGVTRKKLRSDAQYYFGDSVKNIQGIIRFNNTLGDIAHHSDRTLSSLHDYYDQSHFINDFKARTGITPRQYRKLCQLHPVIKYTPNFISMPRETFLQLITS
jgi:AraC-like DNA-binding protein